MFYNSVVKLSKKRNAYKINPNTGVYGDVTIDMPKLYGQLKLIAHKDGKKVYDKQVDFDTLDLLTKRFNSKKKYSPLSKMVFDELNRISDIPIHRAHQSQKGTTLRDFRFHVNGTKH